MAPRDDDDPKLTVKAKVPVFMANRLQQAGDVFSVPESQFNDKVMEVVDEKEHARAQKAQKDREKAASEDKARAEAGRVLSDPAHARQLPEEPKRK